MSSLNRNGKTDLQPAEIAPAAAGEATRRNPLLVLWHRRWIIVTCLCFSLAAAWAYLATATPIYESSAQLQIEQNTPRIIASDPNAAVMGSAQNFLWTQCSLIRSRDFLKIVAAEPGIRDLPTFALGTDAVSTLRGIVNATVGRRDEIITVSVRSPHQEDAMRIANAVVIAFIKYHDSTKRSNARELLNLLQKTKVDLDRELGEKRRQKLEFQTRHAGMSLGSERTNPTMERMARLSAVLTEMQINTLNAQAAYETAKAMKDDPVKSRQLLETRQFKSETAQMRSELRELQARLAGMSKSYLPGFPELSAIQNSIKQLSQDMAAEDLRIIEAYVNELEAHVQAARRSEQHIEALLNAQGQAVLQLNTASAQFALLESELSSLERFADEIYSRMKQLSLTEDAGALNIRPVESAIAAGRPVEPSTKATLAYSLFMGGFIGVLLAFLRDWMDQRLRSAEEIKQVLALPVLGVVPHMSAAETPSERGMMLHNEPMSDVAEAYRTVRTAVYFGQAGGVAKTLLITSPAPGDGKTTLASNLAIAMAQAGNRILLLDADFRKPTQHKIFQIDKRVGLSSVLAGEVQLAEAIHSTAVSGLDVLPCGPIPANPSEILNSQTFADVLQELCSRYDHVLLDSPPIMPVTDARILAASCDATVLALRAERSTRKGAIYARDMLNSVGSRILGVVVNDVPRRKGVYGYYYTYGEHYQYGYGAGRRSGNSSRKAKSNGTSTEVPKSPSVKQQV